MEDLGKADGSYLGASAAWGINDSGLVVGSVDTPGGHSAFVWDPARRDMRLLPRLSHGDVVFEARAVSEQGLAVGCSNFTPVIWDLGREPIVCEPLLAPEETAAHGSTAYALNRRGEIVGWGHRLNLNPLGFLFAWNREEGKAESRSFDVANWEPWAVNDELDIAGVLYPHPVLWQVRKRQLHLLPLLDAASWGVAKGVNAQPMAVGYCGSEGPTRACIWYFDRGANHYLSHWAVQELGALGGPECGSEALAVNDKGQVVGQSETAPGSDVWHACLWERDQEGKWSIRDLGTLP
jgi:probable HAF family extracellular repeat protein